MSIDQFVNLLATVTLFEMMVTIGLGVAVAEVAAVARDWRAVACAGLANYVIVPLVALGLLLLFHAAPLVAAGFLIAAVCPGDAQVQIDVVKMIGTLLGAQLLPLGIGLFLRHRRPALADRLQKPGQRLTVILNLLLLAIILTVQFDTLIAIPPRAFVGMTAFVAAGLAAGWLLGGPGSGERTAMAMATAVRNVAVTLVIAMASFPGTPAVTAATAFGLFQTILVALAALAWGRLATAAAATGK